MMPYYTCPFMQQYGNFVQTPSFGSTAGSQYPQAYNPYTIMSGQETETDETASMEMTPPRQPAPILSNNPAVVTVSAFKELTAYPNYGNPSRNADILYTGNRGTWTFDIPPFLLVPGNLRARLIIRAVLDDHANVPVNRYSANISVNGVSVHTGRLNLEHGVPVGGIFTNWRNLSFNVTNLRRSTRVTIENTSTTGENDWIAFDWMEIRLTPR